MAVQNKNAGGVYSAAIIAGGCLWGTMGLFRRALGSAGLSTGGVILVRCIVAALLYAVTILLTDRSRFHIRLQDLWCFLGAGLCSLLFFTICYFQAMTCMSLSTAAILLYTAPCFVILMSAVLFKERITRRIVLAMLLAFAGCCLVSGIMGGDNQLSLVGVLYGLGSGFGYALYTIFSKLAMQRSYHPITINLYSCLFAGLGSLFFCRLPQDCSVIFSSSGNVLLCLATGFVTFYLPYYLYTYGLTCTASGKAAIMASVEPVVATVMGILFYHEIPDLWAVLGIVLVLAAIVLTNTSSKVTPAE